ncbi:MAG: hypothetical protein WD066_01870 [Planctomycetaceae bacterium]
MNKAFVREPEDHGDRCPRCGSRGREVFEATLVAQLPPEERARIGEPACFCPHATCEVAYFDRFERTVEVAGLRRPVFPKDPQAPICPCFGLTVEEIEADARDGSVARLKEHRLRAESPEARCATAAPDGRSCIPAVQRHYFKSRGG